MSNTINCDSCGGSNQLPEGKTSMFCAFCGNAIEKKEDEQTSLNQFPKIISTGKKEKKFEDTSWYRVNKEGFSEEISSLFKLKRIEHYRTNDGYNVTKFFDRYDIISHDWEEDKSTHFVPFAYDLSEYKSELNLAGKGITSFEELLQHYELEEIENLTYLNLDNNKITDWKGVKNFTFKYLNQLSIKNNGITSFPYEFKHQPNGSEHDLKVLDLTNNKIEDIGDINRCPFNCRIILKDNPIGGSEFPQLKETETNLKFELSNIKTLQEIKNKQSPYLHFVLNEKQNLFYEYQEHKPTPRATTNDNLKKTTGKNSNGNTIQENFNNSILDNYSEKQITLATIHFLSPLVLFFIFENDAFSSMDFSFLVQLATACFITGIIYALIVSPMTKNIKTGYSFKTKSGVRFDEYQKQETPGIPISSLHAGIGFFHIGFPIVYFVIYLVN
ncbi:hypothetical protein N9E81_00420 [Algibacter sp.]|nr:hypothetical protein [Algibacter sp.]